MRGPRLAPVGLIAIMLSVSVAAGPPVSLPTVPGEQRSFGNANESIESARSGGLINAWRFGLQWQRLAGSYRAALSFAECATRSSPALSAELLTNPMGDPVEASTLRRLVNMNRGCVGEVSEVSPLLLRAAVVEAALKDPGDEVAGAVAAFSVGVPQVVDGYPLGAVSRCQVESAPALVSDLLATRPGDEAERIAAERLYSTLGACGTTRGLGGIAPTAARLALIDALHAQRLADNRHPIQR